MILATLVLTLGIWLFCQCRFLYALQSTSRDHWQSLVSLCGQPATQHRPYLESSSIDDATQTFPEPARALRHRHPRKSNKMPNIQGNGSQTMDSDYGYPVHTDEYRRLARLDPLGVPRPSSHGSTPPPAPVLLERHPAAARHEVPPRSHLGRQYVHRARRTIRPRIDQVVSRRNGTILRPDTRGRLLRGP